VRTSTLRNAPSPTLPAAQVPDEPPSLEAVIRQHRGLPALPRQAHVSGAEVDPPPSLEDAIRTSRGLPPARRAVQASNGRDDVPDDPPSMADALRAMREGRI
jgi:hypothetical protein